MVDLDFRILVRFAIYGKQTLGLVGIFLGSNIKMIYSFCLKKEEENQNKKKFAVKR